MTTEEIAEKPSRMSAADRREQILAAAIRAFARSGYSGTSTDAVAREAGVSQPYVVRLFGTKAKLFHEVFGRAVDTIIAIFEAEFDRVEIDPDGEEFWGRLGAVYGQLIEDRNLPLVLMHGFCAGSIPEIGPAARVGMSRIYQLISARVGCTPERARSFIAESMLLNCLLAIQAPEHAEEDPALAELSVCAFGGSLEGLGRTSRRI